MPSNRVAWGRFVRPHLYRKLNNANDIKNYFPQVDIKEILFDNQPDRNTISFTLVYTIANFGITDDITILLQ